MMSQTQSDKSDKSNLIGRLSSLWSSICIQNQTFVKERLH